MQESISSHPSCVVLRAALRKFKDPLIIGIAGDSGSGKTTYSNGIRRLLGNDIVKTLHMDGYHKEDRKTREKTGHLPLDPECNKFDLFQKHLSKIKKNQAVEIPIYNHKTGTFNKPALFIPSAIVIVEGLHALYPQFIPFLDFTIYADPSREVKWDWKYRRDVKLRGHRLRPLKKEMLDREAAYKRWIDFQKINADVVIKIARSQIKQFARYELVKKLSEDCYKVELIVKSAELTLPSLSLPVDLPSLFDKECEPFLLSIVPSLYWGKKASVVHIDGVLPVGMVKVLEKYLSLCTGITSSQSLSKHEEVTATKFTQLLVTWRFLQGISEINVKKKL